MNTHLVGGCMSSNTSGTSDASGVRHEDNLPAHTHILYFRVIESGTAKPTSKKEVALPPPLRLGHGLATSYRFVQS